MTCSWWVERESEALISSKEGRLKSATAPLSAGGVNGVGTLTVSGNESLFRGSGTVTVGESGSGTLSVESGAWAELEETIVGAGSAGQGTVNVSGGSSRLDFDELTVGQGGYRNAQCRSREAWWRETSPYLDRRSRPRARRNFPPVARSRSTRLPWAAMALERWTWNPEEDLDVGFALIGAGAESRGTLNVRGADSQMKARPSYGRERGGERLG